MGPKAHLTPTGFRDDTGTGHTKTSTHTIQFWYGVFKSALIQTYEVNCIENNE